MGCKGGFVDGLWVSAGGGCVCGKIRESQPEWKP